MRKTQLRYGPVPIREVTVGKLRAFICYARADWVLVEPIVSLVEEAGIKAFVDKRDLLPGEPYPRELLRAIANAEIVIFFASPASVASEFCLIEVQEAAQRGKKLLPIVIDGPPSLSAMPNYARGMHFLPADGLFSIENHTSALRAALLDNADWLHEQTRLGHRADSWIDGGRRTIGLLSREELESAERWRNAAPAKSATPSPAIISLLASSRKNVDRNRRVTTILGLLGGAIATVAAVTFFALWQRTQVAERSARNAAYAIASSYADLADGVRRNALNVAARDLKTAEGMLENILGEANRVAELLPDVPELQQTIGRIHSALSDAIARQGDESKPVANAHARKACVTLEQSTPWRDNVVAMQDLLTCRLRILQTANSADKNVFEADMRRVQVLSSQLLDRFSQDRQAVRVVAVAIGTLAGSIQDKLVARQLFSETERLFTQLLTTAPPSDLQVASNDLAILYSNLINEFGDDLTDQDRSIFSNKLQRLQERLASDNSRDMLRTRASVVSTLTRLECGRSSEICLERLLDSIEVQRGFASDDPSFGLLRDDVAASIRNAARLHAILRDRPHASGTKRLRPAAEALAAEFRWLSGLRNLNMQEHELRAGLIRFLSQSP